MKRALITGTVLTAVLAMAGLSQAGPTSPAADPTASRGSNPGLPYQGYGANVIIPNSPRTPAASPVATRRPKRQGNRTAPPVLCLACHGRGCRRPDLCP